MHAIRTNALLTLILLLSPLACGDGDDAGSGDSREISGLDRCTVQTAGYHYIGYAMPSKSVKAGSVKLAVMQALGEINEAGGVGGRPIGLVVCDTLGEEVVAAEAVAELGAASPLSGVIGTGGSGTMIAAAPEAIAAKKVLISPSATSPAISVLEDDGYINRTAVSDAYQGVVLALIARREQMDEVFVVHLEGPWGEGLRDEFVAAFEAEGGTWEALAFDSASLDAEAVATAARDSGADAILLASFSEEGAAIVKAVHDIGWSPRWLLTDGLKDTEMISASGVPAQLEGAIGTSPAVPEGEDYDRFHDAFVTRWGEEPLTFSAAGYDGTMLIAISMALAADPDSGAAVGAQLANTSAGDPVRPGEWSRVLELLAAGATSVDYVGASGPVDLDASGDVLGKIEEWRITDGAFESAVGCWTPAGEACE
jgi:branched-chain amino acid transport system substrate-binding protein